MLLAIAIFVVTITMVIWQPRGLGIGWSAIGGALLALATGVISFADIPMVWDIIWNATRPRGILRMGCAPCGAVGARQWSLAVCARGIAGCKRCRDLRQ
jgi:hypothetical protein